MKILLVEDSALLRERVIDLLNGVDGATVAGFAEDVEPAIAAIDAMRPDLVVLDIQLKTGNGRDVLDYVVRVYPQTKVFIFTNLGGDSVRNALLRSGATDFFDKATDFFALRDAVAALGTLGNGH